MKQTELKVRDVDCPEWVDEWLWDGIVEEMGGLTIARVRGDKIVVCPCCNEVHRTPIIEPDEFALRSMFERLGVDLNRINFLELAASWQG